MNKQKTKNNAGQEHKNLTHYSAWEIHTTKNSSRKPSLKHTNNKQKVWEHLISASHKSCSVRKLKFLNEKKKPLPQRDHVTSETKILCDWPRQTIVESFTFRWDVESLLSGRPNWPGLEPLFVIKFQVCRSKRSWDILGSVRGGGGTKCPPPPGWDRVSSHTRASSHTSLCGRNEESFLLHT